MITESDLVSGVFILFKLIKYVNGIDDTQHGIQTALRANHLINHHGLNNRARIGQPGGLDNDPIEPRLFCEQGAHRPDQIAPDDTADTAAIKFYEFFVAGLDQIAVDPDIAKLIDDNRELSVLKDRITGG